ncbi:MAG: hypothetical protein SWX82_10640 [Cyanobacteriota bacterium]|nr:hypothetical protein [Cyanobacteriota bacterium]
MAHTDYGTDTRIGQGLGKVWEVWGVWGEIKKYMSSSLREQDNQTPLQQ